MKVNWHKSSHSSGGDNCVEVAVTDEDTVLVRHSRNGLDVLAFTPGEWSAFRDGVKAGEFD